MDGHRVAAVMAPTPSGKARAVTGSRLSTASGFLRSIVVAGSDVVLVGLVVVCFPFVLLLLGLPIALLLLALVEGLERLF